MKYTKREELFNVITHGIGAVLAIAGSVLMMIFTTDVRSTAAVAIYGISMILLYSASTAYHATSKPKVKRVLQILDHAGVYLLIAGCYTPFILVLLRESVRAPFLFASLWIMATAGIVLNIININRFKKITLALYLLMGWIAVFDIRNIFSGLGTSGIVLLLTGGLSYTIGVIFYKMKKIRYMHGVWHLFVLAGGILHYICIYRFII